MNMIGRADSPENRDSLDIVRYVENLDESAKRQLLIWLLNDLNQFYMANIGADELDSRFQVHRKNIREFEANYGKQ